MIKQVKHVFASLLVVFSITGSSASLAEDWYDVSSYFSNDGSNNNSNDGSHSVPNNEVSNGLSNNAISNYVSNFDTESASCCPRLPVGIIVDRKFSPIVGASLYKTLLRGYQVLDDEWLPDNGDRNAYMRLGRFGKLVLENVGLFYPLMVVQHEIFGHGARAREFNLPVEYQINFRSGSTKFSSARYNQLSPSEKMAFVAGGMEGTGIVGKHLRDQFLFSKIIDERAAHAYLVNMLDQPEYIFNARNKSISSGNDVHRYMAELNKWHGHSVIDIQSLRRKAAFDFADPFLFYSLFAMGQYIFDGTKCWEYPMIPIGNYQYLPGFRTALAPYGPETVFLNYLKGTEHDIQASIRYGRTGSHSSFGASAEITRLWCSDLFNVDGKFDVWAQPRLFTATAAQAKRRLGAAASVIARYRLADCIELIGQVGYKSQGYMPGEALKDSPILRIGFNADI